MLLDEENVPFAWEPDAQKLEWEPKKNIHSPGVDTAHAKDMQN